MALKTTTEYVEKGEVKEFSDVLGVINDSNTPVYYDFEDMPDFRGGVVLLKKGNQDKFPTATVWVRATTASSKITIMRSI